MTLQLRLYSPTKIKNKKQNRVRIKCIRFPPHAIHFKSLHSAAVIYLCSQHNSYLYQELKWNFMVRRINLDWRCSTCRTLQGSLRALLPLVPYNDPTCCCTRLSRSGRWTAAGDAARWFDFIDVIRYKELSFYFSLALESLWLIIPLMSQHVRQKDSSNTFAFVFN